MLDLLIGCVAAVALGVALIGGVRARQAIASVHGAVGLPTWGALVGALVIQLIITLGWTPHAPWHANFHGIERFAWLAHHGWWEDAWSGNLHGPGWYLLIRLLSAPTAGLLDPFIANALLTALATPVAFALVHVVTRDRQVAATVAILHALLPLRLRVAASLTLYTGVELAWLAALWLTAVHVRDGSRATLVPAVAAAVFAVHTHLELIPALPLAALATAAAVAPAGPVPPERRRRALGAVAVAALACLPLVAAVLFARSGHVPGPPATADPIQAGMRTRAIVAAIVVAVFAWARPPTIDRLRDAMPRAVPVVLCSVACLWIPWMVGLPSYEGLDRLPHAWPALRTMHAFFSPDVTPPWLVVLAGLGAAWTWVAAPTSLRVAFGALAALVYFHAGTHDVASTYVRAALPALLPLVWPAGLLLHAAIGRAAPAAALAIATLGLAPYLGWLGWSFPEQQEFLVARAAVQTAAREELPLVMPIAEDAPEAADLEAHRGYLRDLAGDVPVLGYTQLASGLPGPAIVLRSLACQRAVQGRALAGRPRTLWAGGRLWTDWTSTPTITPLQAVSPCWYDHALAACADPPTCTTWSCPAGATSSLPVPPVVDPTCVDATTLGAAELLLDERVREGSLMGEHYLPGAHLTVHRVEAGP